MTATEPGWVGQGSELMAREGQQLRRRGVNPRSRVRFIIGLIGGLCLLILTLSVPSIACLGSPAVACDSSVFGKVPFSPQAFVNLSNPTVGSESDVLVRFLQNDYEEHAYEFEVYLPKEWTINLGVPLPGETIGTFEVAVAVGPDRRVVTVEGTIVNHNDHTSPPHPDIGTYHWRGLATVAGVELSVDAFIEERFDGGLFLSWSVPPDLVHALMALDVRVLEVKARLNGRANRGVFLRNPSDPGQYTFSSRIDSIGRAVRHLETTVDVCRGSGCPSET